MKSVKIDLDKILFSDYSGLSLDRFHCIFEGVSSEYPVPTYNHVIEYF